MTNAMLTTLLQSLGVLGIFLLIGTFLRAKISLFQKTFLPASVIGGFLLLILGPSCLKLLPIPDEWMSIYSMIPGILIVPVVTATPLGMRLSNGSGKRESGASAGSSMVKMVVLLTTISLAVNIFQFFLGFATHAAFRTTGQEFYDTFGWEMGLGFAGGHGTAAMLGQMLEAAGLPYWQTAQGVGVTTATFGLVGGIIIGITMINWAARTGRTSILKKPADIPTAIKVGFEADPKKQNSLGRETTNNSSIDTLAFHAAIIFVVCTISYWILGWGKANKIVIIKDLSVWTIGLLVMFAVWGLMCKLKLDFLIDNGAKGKITGPFTEFAVIGAIASLPLQAVATYIVPILVMCVLGYIGTTAMMVFLCKRCLKGEWFEHMMVIFGSCTGVFLTGVLLLRICDPNFESQAIGNTSLAYGITGIVYFGILNVILSMLLNQGIIYTTIAMFAAAFVLFAATLVLSRIFYGKEFKGNV